MPLPASRSRFGPPGIDVWIFASGVVLLVVTVVLSRALATEMGEMLTRNTVRLSLSWYALTLCVMMRLAACDWDASTPAGRAARDCWTLALLCFLVHLSMAFHYYHYWSHAHAFERTREIGGVGEGIYVSYLFTVVWALDVSYWWLRPTSYATRSAWLGIALHGFMLFIVFNSTVIYETGPIRWAGILLFGGLAAVWLATRRRRRSQLAGMAPI
ncbi:MAG TPA: hypothetical protein VGG64_18560 [Pirellulales bacterium]|jgi:hypothetical protein